MIDEPVSRDDWKWWKDNSAVLIALLSVAVVAMRVLGVSRGDPETAYAILQDGGTGNVLIATLVSSLGLLAIPASAILGFNARNSWDPNKRGGWRSHRRAPPGRPRPGEQRHTGFLQQSTRFYQLAAGSCIMALVALYMAPASSIIISILIAIPILVTVEWVARKNVPRKRVLTTFIIAYTVAIVLIEAVSPIPWLPEQRITATKGGSFTGYVLSKADGRTYILASHSENVVSYRSENISIVLCTPHFYAWEQATLLANIERAAGKLADYRACQPS